MSRRYPTIILPQTTERYLADGYWVVQNIGPLLPASTPGETGHYDVRVNLERFEQDDGGDRSAAPRFASVDVSIRLLPRLAVHSLWHSRQLVGRLKDERRTVQVSIGQEAFETTTGATIIQRHVLRDERQFVNWHVILGGHPELRCLGGLDFLESKFIQLTFYPNTGGTPIMYVAAMEIFRECYFHSSSICDHVLAGRAVGEGNFLYRPDRTIWISEDEFQVDTYRRFSARSECAIAALVCSNRSRLGLQNIRASVVSQAVVNKPIYLSANWPFSGVHRITAYMYPLPGARGVYLASRIARIDGAFPFETLRVFRYQDDDRNMATELEGKYPHTRIPSRPVDPSAELAPNSREEGSNKHESAALYDDALSSAWVRRGICKTTKILEKQKRPRRLRPPADSMPHTGEFSPVISGSTAKGLRMAHQVNAAKESLQAVLLRFATVNDLIGSRFRELLSKLTDHGFVVRPVDGADDPAFEFELRARTASDSWLWVLTPCGEKRLRNLNYAMVGVLTQRGPTGASCLLFDFERPEPEHPPYPIHVIAPNQRLNELALLHATIRCAAAHGGRIPKSDPAWAIIRSRQIRDQQYLVPHGGPRSRWNILDWGGTKIEHHAYKVGQAVKSLLTLPRAGPAGTAAVNE